MLDIRPEITWKSNTTPTEHTHLIGDMRRMAFKIFPHYDRIHHFEVEKYELSFQVKANDPTEEVRWQNWKFFMTEDEAKLEAQFLYMAKLVEAYERTHNHQIEYIERLMSKMHKFNLLSGSNKIDFPRYRDRFNVQN